MFLINEIFTSLQGEGGFAGTPAHFVRFQGCPLRCHFCDSQSTWESPGPNAPWTPEALRDKMLALRAEYPNIRHLVLTGGEPLYNNERLPELLRFALGDMGWRVQIETSGTCLSPETAQEMREAERTGGLFVTLSPKAPRPDDERYREVREELFPLLGEIKFPVAGELDILRRIPDFLKRHAVDIGNRKPAIRLQPVDFGDARLNAAANKLCVNAAMQNGWQVSVQMHKFLRIQ